MNKYQKTIDYFVIIFSLIFVIILEWFIYNHFLSNKNYQNNQPNVHSSIATSPSHFIENTQEEPLPAKVQLDVPFLVQAPFANWDDLHEQACEEASLIMVVHFLKNTRIASPEVGDQEINDLIRFENNNGYQVDVTLEELSQIAKDYYGLNNAVVKKDFSIEDIKKELALGQPVIIPAAGKILPNPNFRGGGPNYHMLVIKGYDQNGFITNDPGTRKGEGFRYNFDDLYNAIHDFDENNILEGQKAYLVFE